MTQRHLNELSSLKYSFFTSALPSRSHFQILTIAFEGECGYGSGNNSDAAFMSAIIAAGLEAWQCEALILDLRKLSYEWGDEMVKLFGVHPGHTVAGAHIDFPVAALVSNRNRKGLTSLVRDEMSMRPQLLLFESFDTALQEIERQITAIYGTA